MSPLISVIIVTYYREAALIATITSVWEQVSPSFEVIVVDQTPVCSVELKQFLEAASARLRYFRVTPPSMPAARNFGLAHALGDVIIYLDDDVVVHAGCLAAHAEAYKNPAIGAVAGRVNQEGFVESVVPIRLFLGGDYTGSNNCTVDQPCDSAQGCNMSFRADALRRAGGFDTRLFRYRDDSDACYRVRKEGYAVVFRTAASVRHLAIPSGGTRRRLDMWCYASTFREETLFFLKHWPKRKTPAFLGVLLRKHVLSGRYLVSRWTPLRFWALCRGFLSGCWHYWHPTTVTSSLVGEG